MNTMKSLILITLTFAFSFYGCTPKKTAEEKETKEQAKSKEVKQNTLTENEIAEGWQPAGI